MQETYNNIQELVPEKRVLLSKIMCRLEASKYDFLNMYEDNKKCKTWEERSQNMDKWLKIWGKKLKAVDANSPLLKELEELTLIKI